MYIKFNTLLEAWQFIAIVNAGEGFPTGGTITYCLPEIHNENYYIKNDEVIEKYRGNLQLVELNLPEENDI